MKLAFCLFKFFPYGGMERNMLAIARACVARGHQLTVLCHRWQGPEESGFDVVQLPVKSLTNAGRMQQFSDRVSAWVRDNPVDLLVGFNKIPGLDVYYAADTCFAYRASYERGWFYRQLPRTRQYLKAEQAVFGAGSRTEILEVSRAQRSRFMHSHRTSEKRFHTLPPGIARNRVMPENYAEIRARTRAELDLDDEARVLVTVGSDFLRKGVDRCIRALPALTRDCPDICLLVVGKGQPEKLQKLAARLGVAGRVRFLGVRDDVPALLQAADVFLHPAYEENTGNVLLEAAIAGLPVVATDVCGYAHYIDDYEVGAVVTTPFSGEKLEQAITEVLGKERQYWRRQGARLAREGDIYSRPERAAEYLEAIGARLGNG